MVETLVASDEHADQRQIGVVDSKGRSATYTGGACMDWAGGIAHPNFATQGNILASGGVVKDIAAVFEASGGCLADRLLAALRAGQAAGGDRRGQQSAALYIAKPAGGYGGFNDRYIDLRVDDHAQPIEELARLLELHKLYSFKAEPADLIAIDEAIGQELCGLLVRAGVLAGSHATFDAAANEALTSFMHRENLENRVRDDGKIDRQTLGYLRRFAPA